jgi:hypothetical protein
MNSPVFIEIVWRDYAAKSVTDSLDLTRILSNLLLGLCYARREVGEPLGFL